MRYHAVAEWLWFGLSIAYGGKVLFFNGDAAAVAIGIGALAMSHVHALYLR